MKIGIFFLLLAVQVKAQLPATNPRAMISIMAVLPSDTSATGEGRSADPSYTYAISIINNALINMGYTKTLDELTRKRVIADKASLGENRTKTPAINTYIRNAPVDMIIVTDIQWIDPPGNPRDRQARLRLKAIDNYTGVVYADIASIQSSQREFPDLGTAVQTTLERDAKVPFRNFLNQLDSSYANLLRHGRPVSIVFGVDRESSSKFTDRVGNATLGDTIISYVRQKALHGQYSIIGESTTHLEFLVAIPVIDEQGNHNTPSWYLRKDMDSIFRQLGFEVTYAVVGSWIQFTLVRRAGS